MIKYEDFTPETQEEILGLIKDKMSAFDLLTKNYNSAQVLDIDSSKIVSRLQTQYVALDRDEKALRTSEEWFQNEFYQPNRVNVDVAPVIKGKYSSFALLKTSDNYRTDFPLDDDYATDAQVFNDKTFADASFEIELARFKDKLGLEIKQDKIIKTTTYKHNTAIKAITKIQNFALHLFKKPLKVTGLFSGKMTLKTRYSNNYSISNIEKLAKVYDTVLGVAVKNEAKGYKKQLGKKADEIAFASQLFADVLMSRVYDLKDVKNNKQLEKCFWLQFANTLNRYGFSAEQLKLITEIGTKSAATVCKQLGFKTDDIVARMQKLGYVYNVVPADEFQALLCVRYRDYEAFKQEGEEIKEEPKPQTAGTEEPVDDDNVSFKEEGTKVRKTTAERVIDKSIVKYLADQSTKLAEKINQGKFKGKKLQVAIEEQRLTNLILSYYVQAVNAKPMSVKNDNTYNENEISKAKVIVKGICLKRDELVNAVINRDKAVDQKASTFVNAVSKEMFKQSARDYFVGKIKDCIKFCLFGDFKSTKKKSKTEEETVKLLESGKRLLEAAKKETTDTQKTDDETKTEEQKDDAEEKRTDYVPNFVIVDNNDDFVK